LPDICASIQGSIVDILSRKIEAAALANGIQHIGISGGVAANSGLRKRMLEMGEKHGWTLYFPALQYCTDNAGMIAIAAYFQYLDGKFAPLETAPFAKGS
jgi:N6-L-threonylcarbamoyladenine synthase